MQNVRSFMTLRYEFFLIQESKTKIKNEKINFLAIGRLLRPIEIEN